MHDPERVCRRCAGAGRTGAATNASEHHIMIEYVLSAVMPRGARCGILAGILVSCAAVTAHGGLELLVSGFSSDSVARFDLGTSAYLSSLDSAAGIDGPLCCRVGPDGLLYVASEGTDSIVRYNATSGAFVDTFVSGGSGGLDGPTGVTWDHDGNLLVPSFNTDSVLKYNGATGAFMSVLVSAGLGSLNGPDNGSIVGPDGNLYVPSYYTNRILRYSPTGAFLGNFVTGISRPRVLEFRGSSLFVTSETANAVREYNATTGAFIRNFVATSSGGLSVPIGMVFGPDGYLYVASSGNGKILRYNGTTGAFVDTYLASGAGGIQLPAFLTVIPSPGGGVVLALGLGAVARRQRARS